MFNTKHYLRSKGHFKPAQLQRKFYTETAETDFKQNLTTTQKPFNFEQFENDTELSNKH